MKQLRLIALLLLLLSFAGVAWSQIAIYGDTRSHPEVHRKLIKSITAHHPKLAIHTGDLNSKGVAQHENDETIQVVQPGTSLCPFYAVKGNHEKFRSLFLKNFPSLGETGYTSFVAEGIRFYLLDSTSDLNPGSAQYMWLQGALRDSLPGIVVLHHPVFSSGAHGGEELGLQMFLPQLLQKGNILAVFSGHDHDYERSEYQGIQYIVTGGGGAPQREKRSSNPYSKLFAIEYHYVILTPLEDGIRAEVFTPDNELLDSFMLHPREKDR